MSLEDVEEGAAARRTAGGGGGLAEVAEAGGAMTTEGEAWRRWRGMVGGSSEAWQRWEGLFPTPISFLTFILYMGLFINQGLVVKASQGSDSSYSYNTVTAVLMAEVTKLLVSLAMALRDFKFLDLVHEIRANARVLVLYMVPALLYCIYNNLAFVNLAAFDPTTYFMMLQLRVVITGVVFQIVFNKRLSGRQWCSLLILTTGCVLKHMGPLQAASSTTSAASAPHFSVFHFVLLLLQLVCSCLAGVYNEKLLKDTGAEVHIMVQNVYMYLDSIACNAVILAANGQLSSAFTTQVLKPRVVVVFLNNAAIGIVTSFFLKNLNSILKTFASALELSFIAVLSWVIFGITVDGWTVLAILLVTYATFMYSKNPVINKGRLPQLERSQSGPHQEAAGATRV